ncbi:hypothetical protein WJX74_007663 [Apatococcus lobatus]|uniref:Uncharacterized protein n=1 Tax=Apatococcus lobatus TaxID=904363 RepID=A0AAW1S6J8_9CHLO
MASGQLLLATHGLISRQADICSLRCAFDLRRSQGPRARLCKRQACSRVASGLTDLIGQLWTRSPAPPHQLPATSQPHFSNLFTAAATSIGLRLTGVCLRLASIVAEQLIKDAEELRQQKQRLLAAQLLQAQSMLQQHRPDKELMRVIKTLGDSNIPLDTKWLEFTQRLASHGHDAISDSMKQLFTAAGESSQAVQALLSPEQQSKELWKSARTQSVIQQEQAFKQMVFNQLLLTSN